MAKSKPSRKALSKARRHNPIRVPDAHLPHGATPTEDAAKSSGQVIPVLNKLASQDDTDRAWSASTISALISNDPATRRLFLGKGVVEKLINLLSDNNGNVLSLIHI